MQKRQETKETTTMLETALATGLLLEMRGRKNGKREYTAGTDTCICPKCKLEVKHARGIPCNQVNCPKCNIPLTGKGTVGEIK